MPRVEGATALVEIRRVAPRAAVIVVSAMHPTHQEPLLDAGAMAIVPKGIAPFELLERLGAILDRNLTVQRRCDWEAVFTDHRAVVCEGDAATRGMITRVLECCDVLVTAVTDNPSSMLEAVDMSKPEIVVMDIAVGADPQPAVVSEICRRSPRSCVLVYSEFDDLEEITLSAGAIAFVAKPHIGELGMRIDELTLSRPPGPAVRGTKEGDFSRYGR